MLKLLEWSEICSVPIDEELTLSPVQMLSSSSDHFSTASLKDSDPSLRWLPMANNVASFSSFGNNCYF